MSDPVPSKTSYAGPKMFTVHRNDAGSEAYRNEYVKHLESESERLQGLVDGYEGTVDMLYPQRVKDEIERLRAALSQISAMGHAHVNFTDEALMDHCCRMWDVARAALEPADEKNDALAGVREIIEARCVDGPSVSLADRLTRALNCRDAWADKLIAAARAPSETAAVINLDEPIPAACKCHYQSTPNMFHMAYSSDCPLHGNRMLRNAVETDGGTP